MFVVEYKEKLMEIINKKAIKIQDNLKMFEKNAQKVSQSSKREIFFMKVQ